MKQKLHIFIGATLLILVSSSCQKFDRPALGSYPRDANPPGGPLKFYVAFDGTSADPLRNAVDSIKANFAASNPLASITGINGKAVQGAFGKAIKYSSANDFSKSTSFTVAFWGKNTVPVSGPQFAFSLPDKDFWSSSAMFLLFDNGGATTDSAVIKFHVDDNSGNDHWFELTGANRMYKIYDGNWHHLAFAYDETTSNMTIYRDGLLKNTLNWSGHGKIKLTPASVSNFVIGGWNKHAGLDGPNDSWIESWQGGLDQFRLYSKALSAAEVLALYNSKL